MAAGKDSQVSLNSDLDHSKVENCFHEFYTEVNMQIRMSLQDKTRNRRTLVQINQPSYSCFYLFRSKKLKNATLFWHLNSKLTVY